MKKPKLNVRLLRKIQKHILEEPRRFFMDDVVLIAKTQEEWESFEPGSWGRQDLSHVMPPCGTAACIAGWANLLSGAKSKAQYQDPYRAAKCLGLPHTFRGFDDSLVFFAPLWPEPFRSRYDRAKTPKTRAKVAAARIDHLIATGE